MPTVLVDDDTAWLSGFPGGTGTRTAEVVTGRTIVVDDPVGTIGPWATAPLAADNMLLTATFDVAGGRVELVGTGLDVLTRVRVERSLDGVTWTTVRGGASVVPNNGVVVLFDHEFADGVTNFYRLVTLAPFGQVSNTAMVVPALGDVWLRSLSRPFLSVRATVVQPPPLSVGYTARTGVLPIKGRTFPVAVNDLRLARRWVMHVQTETPARTAGLRYLLASGEVLLVHVPLAAVDAIPGGYVTVGDAAREHHPLRHDLVTWTLPMTEVAPPGPHVVPAQATWQTVVDTYASWADVLAAHSSWGDLVATLVGDPSEAVIP